MSGTPAGLLASGKIRLLVLKDFTRWSLDFHGPHALFNINSFMVTNTGCYFTFIDKCPVISQEQVEDIAGVLFYAGRCTDYLVKEGIFDD